MYSWTVIVGLIVVTILLLIPVVMVGQLLYGIIASIIEHRRTEARKITAVVPGLGLLSTTDSRLWSSEVRNLQVTLMCEGSPPTHLQAMQLASVLDQLPSLTMRARAFLSDHEDMCWLEGGAAAFEPFGIDFDSESNFTLEFTHPSDTDGIYRVEFQKGVAVSSVRDD